MDELRLRLREAVLDLLWEQWGALGAAGLSLAKKVPFVVDPEALLLATMRFGAGEARLTDEVLDWLFLSKSSLNA